MRSLTAADAARYDVLMQRLERRFFPDTRDWVCRRASGTTLEIAVGTGLNLSHYAPDVRLTAVDADPAVLGFASTRARAMNRAVTLAQADALDLPYPGEHFDAVVCTFVLCEVADDAAAIVEALRVLRPGGSLLLADHVVSTNPLVRLGQRMLEAVTVRASGEHFTRRPSQHLAAAGAEVVAADRFSAGAIERVHAIKPGSERAVA
jgi:ubiquinone/menaquinone biosynthesis C-methylase UbiE